MVDFLSLFCPELQNLLKHIYDLTRKGRPFVWGKGEEDSFEEFKCRLIKPPILHIQISPVDFIYILTPVNLLLEVHYTKYRMANPSLSHMPAKDARSSKKLFHTELELCGLTINIASFSHVLKRVDFDAITDHLSLTHIIKSKTEPATVRIKDC